MCAAKKISSVAGKKGEADLSSVGTKKTMAPDRVYKIYHDGQYPKEFDKDVKEITSKNRDDNWVCRSFTHLQIVMRAQCKYVTYESAHYQLEDGRHALYWITDAHAKAMGKVLKSLKAFRLDLAKFQNDTGMDRFTEALSSDVRVGEFFMGYQTLDEVTPGGMRAMARAAHKMHCHRLTIWAQEYQPGALAALGRELSDLGNQTVKTIDVYKFGDSPDERLNDPAIESFLRNNKGIQRVGKKGHG